MLVRRIEKIARLLLQQTQRKVERQFNTHSFLPSSTIPPRIIRGARRVHSGRTQGIVFSCRRASARTSHRRSNRVLTNATPTRAIGQNCQPNPATTWTTLVWPSPSGVKTADDEVAVLKIIFGGEFAPEAGAISR